MREKEKEKAQLHTLEQKTYETAVCSRQMGDHAACAPGCMARGQLGTARWHVHVDGDGTEPSS